MLQLADPFFRHGLRALLLVSINLRLAASFTSFAEVKYRRIIGQQVTGNQIGVKVSSDIARSSFAHCALNCNYKAADNCRAFYFRPTDCSLSDADDRGVKGRCQLIYIANLTTVTVQASSNACQRLYVIDPCWNSNPCVNSGMCNFIGWPKVCNCQPYYGGTYCENDLLPGSCLQLLQRNRSATSGTYLIRTASGRILNKVYCSMSINSGGYTFINPLDVPQLKDSDVAAMFTDKSNFLMTVNWQNGTQQYGVMTQLAIYRTPVNAATDLLGQTYLYFGFVPSTFDHYQTTQGLQANGISVEFYNCDSNPSSYMALFVKQASRSIATGSGPYPSFTDVLGTFHAASMLIPVEYFMFLESGFGGCGWYVQTDVQDPTISAVTGAAIGFR